MVHTHQLQYMTYLFSAGKKLTLLKHNIGNLSYMFFPARKNEKIQSKTLKHPVLCVSRTHLSNHDLYNLD